MGLQRRVRGFGAWWAKDLLTGGSLNGCVLLWPSPDRGAAGARERVPRGWCAGAVGGPPSPSARGFGFPIRADRWLRGLRAFLWASRFGG